MTTDLTKYLCSFGNISELPRQLLLNELDKVWISLGLDNEIPLQLQVEAVGKFYSHPVWILNGLFSELDSDSRSHRVAIANYIKKLGVLRVADYGGGSGVLARFIAQVPDIRVDVIEPYPSSFFLNRVSDCKNVQFVDVLGSNYDLVVAQDVLEHTDDPLAVAVKLISATRKGGYLIFANCFFPVIKCHLPTTFYLRHTFPLLMFFAGLKYVAAVDGAEHALVFKKIGPIRAFSFKFASSVARPFAALIDKVIKVISKFKRDFIVRI
jgi:2-polyprenyl-6-hydroxyphenyl methylase/3-demethylubiquinone-9 3-methyltransferase